MEPFHLFRYLDERAFRFNNRVFTDAQRFAFHVLAHFLMQTMLTHVGNPDDWSYRHVWAMMPALYFLGLWRAKRRYE